MIDLTQRSQLQDTVIGKRIMMIVGEGSVFLMLLALGLWRIQASIRKEMKLVNQQHNFMLSVTHELKTPLAANKLYLQTLLKRELSPEKRAELMQKAVEETQRLELLVEQILTASRLEHEKYPSAEGQTEKLDLGVFLAELIEIHEKRAPFPIEFRIPDNFSIVTDKLALTTILNNIIENAGKYGSAEKGLQIIVQKNDSTFSIFIRDFGKGVDVSDAKSIFQKFIRLENEETRTAKGTGLGLYIAYEFTHSLGGHLRLVPHEGEGACFEIQLPYE